MCNITDEDLNTKSNLITEKYNFELTGLKDPVDVRKPSRNFLKIENLFSKIFSRKIKTGPGLQGEGNLENDLTLSIKSNDPVINISQGNGITLNKTDLTENDSNKLFSAKGALNLLNSLNTNITNTFNTLKDILKKEIIAKQNKIDDTLITINKEIVPAINEIYNKYKCSYRVGDILITTDNQHPALTWIGTTWIKLEGRFLLGTSGNTNAGEIGGVSSISLSIENIPQHRHKVDPHFHTQPSHTHGYIRSRGGNGRFASIDSYNLSGTHQTNSAGGESTGTAAPFTDYQGNGKAFNILPPFIKVHFWKRLS